MYTLYSQLTPEQQAKELAEFKEESKQDAIDGYLCILCGMALHNCLCTHDN